MKRKRHTPEQIVRKLRVADAELSSGTAFEDVVKRLEVSEATYSRWRREYGKTNPERMRELKDLAKENERLKRIVADQHLDIEVLREVVKGKF